MKNYKVKIIIWLIMAIFAFVGIIALSINIAHVNELLLLKEKVTLDTAIVDTWTFSKAYMIGGLAFCCLIFVIGGVIGYAGIKSWKYTDMFI
ncbi:hypothetical protein ACJA23_01240 [Mycoplasma corogypsi]|uniref:hypothetical protein n=1 Tax=Mycoplasma corogypsi TaxID=2106 RepID=UPI0038735531